ncbi:MAG: phosphohistidine phosphatase SixA [Acidobacteriia bacterium]|nr:phosphohistidine phosphatase SixA [Terriglobia bacterium]MYG04450.1 phosphohistidine phosphatase SixA [Terriglobia bacterium]MYK11123.1 phosphohistidine phosphatase SixA [Terriglobia bacterium]
MILYVLRHAIAKEPRPGQSDSTRQLTETGRSRCRRVLAHAKRVKVQPQNILTSPYDRAAQTAEIAKAELGFGRELITSNALLPFVSVQDLWNVIRDYAVGGDVMVVGHNPQLSMLVVWLLGGRADALWLKKSGLVALDISGAGPHPRAELSWLLTPGSVGR